MADVADFDLAVLGKVHVLRHESFQCDLPLVAIQNTFADLCEPLEDLLLANVSVLSLCLLQLSLSDLVS